MNDSYILNDLAGYPYNGKYPPKGNVKNGNMYHGYDTPVQECLFYDFAVLGYDLKIKYHNLYYYFMVDDDCVWLSDSSFCAMRQKFKNGNDVLKHFLIDGKALVNIIDKLDEYEAV